MALNLDPILVANLLFSALIVIVGLFAYWKTKKASPLYVAGAFLLFGLSHVAGILGMADALATVLLVLRIIGYLLVIAVLYLCYAKGAGK